MGLERFLVAKSYDFSAVQVLIGGIKIGGFAEDSGVAIEYDGDISSVKIGADGEACVSRLPLPPANVTLTLMETSASNAILEGFLIAQRNTPAGWILPFVMLDPTTGEKVLSGQCSFANLPNVMKNRESSTREWRLIVPRPVTTYATE